MTLALTTRQTQVLLTFQRLAGAGCSPTLTELAAAAGISKVRAQEITNALVVKGFLVRGKPRAHRNLRLP